MCVNNIMDLPNEFNDDDATDAEYVTEKDDGDNNDEQRKKRGSVVWEHFEELSDYTARCNYCQKNFSYRGSISNLKKHLLCRHRSVLMEEEDGEYESNTNPTSPPQSEDTDSDKKPIQKLLSRRSQTWKFFKTYDRHISKLANCKICNQDVPFCSVSELKFHIANRHGKIALGDVASSDGEMDEVTKDSETTKRRRKRSEGWKYFDVKDPVRKVATCKGCRKDLSYQTISNLMKHVVRAHSKTFASLNSSDDEEKPVVSKRYTTKSKPQKRFRSLLWKYFDVADGEAKIATCRLCSNNFSYNCSSNLRKHLHRRHGGVELDGFSDEEGKLVADVEGSSSSPVWAYFKCLDEALKIASCLICKERVEYNGESELSRHLRRKHPGVDLDEVKVKPKKLMITGDGDIYEIDDDVITKEEPVTEQQDDDSDNDWPYNNDEVEALHAEYLDEEMSDDQQPISPKKRRKHTSNQTSPNTQKTTEEETSLDIFGKYMVSLLKKLPKQKSDQLQVEFVKRIMDTQLRSIQNTRPKPMRIRNKIRSNRNTRYSSHSTNNDDTRVTSNSEVQKVISDEVQDLVLSNEQVIVTSVGDEVTIGTE